ncbi:MAG: hypothetical protein AABO41_07455 [Acidobacteriota bacterium]
MGASKNEPSHAQPTTLLEFLLAFVGENESVRLRAIPPRKRAGSTLKVETTPKQLAIDAAILKRLRRLNEGRGLYFVVNSGGDKDKDITRFNAAFCEADNLSLAEQHALLDAFPLPPSIRVETKKSVHAYWLFSDECTETDWRDIQLRLIQWFKSDSSIKNPSRTMRLPGFNHLSLGDNGELEFKSVSVVEFHPDRRYTPAQLKDAFSRLSTLEARSKKSREMEGPPGQCVSEGGRNQTLT